MSTPSTAAHPDYVPVFVGGAPRTGTTLLSALISTSAACNPFLPEFHYLGTLGMGLIQSLSIYDSSQRLFLPDRDALIRNHIRFMREVMDAAWVTLGCPRYLVLKHCKLTPLFGMLGKHMADARFVVSFRDARDTIASMVRAFERTSHIAGSQRDQYIEGWIGQFNGYYTAVAAAAAREIGDRLLVVDHEHIAAGRISAIQDFLELADMDPSKLWQRALFDVKSMHKDSMFSEHWGAPLTSNAVGTYARTLDPPTAARVLRDTLSVSTAIGELIAEGMEQGVTQ